MISQNRIAITSEISISLPYNEHVFDDKSGGEGGDNDALDTFEITEWWIDTIRCEKISQSNNSDEILYDWKFSSLPFSIWKRGKARSCPKNHDMMALRFWTPNFLLDGKHI